MDEFLKNLQEKYGYNEKLIEVLGKIIPAFVQHFGQENEQLILNALSSCEIHIQQENENSEEYLSTFFPDKNIEKIPTIATAFYDSMPVITDEGITSKRLIYITSKGSTDLQDEKTMSVLVHEIGHLIKAYNKEYSIVDGQIQKRDGIAKTIVTKDEETGKYILGEPENIGLEEAINCYDEEKVMSIILDKQCYADSYFHVLNDGIDILYTEQELIETFRTAQLNGTNEHVKLLGEKEFKTLSECFEDLHFVVTKPSVAKRKSGKSVSQLIDEAELGIENYAKEYRAKKQKNFHGEIEKLDQEVTPEERDKGVQNLKKAVIEEKTNEKEGNGR